VPARTPPEDLQGRVSPFVATIRESNRQARSAWARYEAHRARVTAVLASCATELSSLCLLGPGNLNDVSLERLLKLFAEVHLVDLDVDAVESALERQGVAHDARVDVHRPIDLTGILDRLPTTRLSNGADVAADLVDALAKHRCDVARRHFEVTASTGALTQLLQSVVDAELAPADAPRVAIALRNKHLLDLVHLTRPEGSLVLISDVVSTATAPNLVDAGTNELERELASLVASGNFFTGTNPYRIVALLEDDPAFRSEVTDVRLLDLWLWPVTADRLHLTYAIVGKRRLARQG
jgi:hypothetical protein